MPIFARARACRWCARTAPCGLSDAQTHVRRRRGPSSAGHWPARCAGSSAGPWASCGGYRRSSRSSPATPRFPDRGPGQASSSDRRCPGSHREFAPRMSMGSLSAHTFEPVLPRPTRRATAPRPRPRRLSACRAINPKTGSHFSDCAIVTLRPRMKPCRQSIAAWFLG